MGVSTLIFKTTMILGIQLLILLYCAACWIAQSPGPCFSRVATLKKTPGVGLVSYSAFDKIVMDCGQSKKRRWAVTLGFVSGYVMASMLSNQDLLLGLFGMTLLSVAAAPLLGQMMIDADRGDGKRALKIVILSVGVLGLFGLQYPSDFSVPWVHHRCLFGHFVSESRPGCTDAVVFCKPTKRGCRFVDLPGDSS